MHQPSRVVCRAAASLASVVLGVAAAAAQTANQDVSGMSLQDLMTVEVVSTASKFPQSTSEAPASVTLIDGEEIRQFGYRTLADALRSVRGFYTTYDRNYAYVGMRGFARPGDYNTRMLLLIDGQRLNDGIYDMAPVGTELPIAISLIDRIEIIRGPGSSLYGSNALFGVINVVTKTGGGRKDSRAEVDGGSLGTRAVTASYGRLFGEGGEMLLAMSGYQSSGQHRIHFPEFDRDGAQGIALGLDHDEASTVFGSLSAGRFSFRASAAHRHKHVPTASFESVFADPREVTSDTRALLSGVYDGPLGRDWMVTARVSYDYYGYHGHYPLDYGAEGPQVFEDLSFAQSVTGEVTARRRVGRVHQLTFGAEVRHHFEARQTARDAHENYINLDVPGTSVGVYAQDEVRIRPWLLVNAGARIDRFVDFGARATPRAAVVLLPRPRTAVKLLHGRAFRAPNAYERYYYNYASGRSADLHPERIQSSEIVWEESFSKRWRGTVTAFVYDVERLIEQRGDDLGGIFFANAGGTRAGGIEAEAVARFDRDVAAHVSHTITRARDRERAMPISNSPVHLSKAKVRFPLLGAAVAVEGQYVGERLTIGGEALDGFFLSNVTVSTPADRRFTVQVSIYNVFDQAYADPAAEEHIQKSILQDGRTVRLRAGFRF
jgi:outer membrane receptor for ferrienterochelin and colicins